MKVREALRVLKKDGWAEIGCRGSHRQLKHPRKAGRVTVLVAGAVQSEDVVVSEIEPGDAFGVLTLGAPDEAVRLGVHAEMIRLRAIEPTD